MFSSVQFCDINFKSATKPKPCVRPRCTKFEVDITNIGQAQGQVCVCVCDGEEDLTAGSDIEL